MMADISVEISNEDILLAIKKKLGHANYRILSQTLTPLEEKIGLLGDHLYLNVNVLDNTNNKETALKFFVKSFPKHEAVAIFAHGSGAFRKEEFAYGLFEIFSQMDISFIKNIIANCYVAKQNKYMILDNIVDQDFNIPDKMEYLDYDSILIVLQAIAQLHASSILYEEKMSIKLGRRFSISEENEDIGRDMLYCDTEDFVNRDTVDSTLKCILAEIKMFDFPEYLVTGKSFLGAVEELYPKIFELVKESKRYRNVFSHGDLWSSNFMLKKDAEAKVVACKLVDFQSIRYVPLSHDVLTFIYLNTSRDFRQKHLYELLGVYYNYLEKMLKISGYNLMKIVPFFEFLDSCEEQKLFAVLLAVGIIPLILSDRKLIETYFSDKELYQKVMRKDRSVLITDNKDNVKFMRRAIETVEDLRDECERYFLLK